MYRDPIGQFQRLTFYVNASTAGTRYYFQGAIGLPGTTPASVSNPYASN